MTDKPTRRYELNIEKIETFEDVKKILKVMRIQIDTDNPIYEEVKDYFGVEIVPIGYLKLLEEVGHEEIAKMTYDEMKEKISTLFSKEEENQ